MSTTDRVDDPGSRVAGRFFPRRPPAWAIAVLSLGAGILVTPALRLVLGLVLHLSRQSAAAYSLLVVPIVAAVAFPILSCQMRRSGVRVFADHLVVLGAFTLMPRRVSLDQVSDVSMREEPLLFGVHLLPSVLVHLRPHGEVLVRNVVDGAGLCSAIRSALAGRRESDGGAASDLP